MAVYCGCDHTCQHAQYQKYMLRGKYWSLHKKRCDKQSLHTGNFLIWVRQSSFMVRLYAYHVNFSWLRGRSSFLVLNTFGAIPATSQSPRGLPIFFQVPTPYYGPYLIDPQVGTGCFNTHISITHIVATTLHSQTCLHNPLWSSSALTWEIGINHSLTLFGEGGDVVTDKWISNYHVDAFLGTVLKCLNLL